MATRFGGVDGVGCARFAQRIDHFDPQNTATFQQRFFVNETYWDSASGPVFFMLGGEGPGVLLNEAAACARRVMCVLCACASSCVVCVCVCVYVFVCVRACLCMRV